MIAERNSKFKSRIKSVTVNLANVVVHATRTQHRPGNPRADRQLGRKFADILGAADHDLIANHELFELVDETWEKIDNLFCTLHPIRRRVASAAAKTHVIAHHPRAGK